MKQFKLFHLCDNNITSERIFRANFNYLPCASCGETEQKLGAGSELQAITTRLGVTEGGEL